MTNNEDQALNNVACGDPISSQVHPESAMPSIRAKGASPDQKRATLADALRHAALDLLDHNRAAGACIEIEGAPPLYVVVGHAAAMGKLLPGAATASASGDALYVECRECAHCPHVGINDSSDTLAACHNCDWSGPSPVEDHCPGCADGNCMGAACPKCGSIYRLLADSNIAATPVPRVASIDTPEFRELLWAFLRTAGSNSRISDLIAHIDAHVARQAQAAPADVRDAALEDDGVSLIAAERRRQVEREGWSAEDDDEHEDASLAMAAALYASPEPLYTVQKAPNSIAWTDPWPWHDQVQGARGGWHKVPAWDKRKTHPRLRQLVIAGALIAAELDRLNRAALRTTSTPADDSQPSVGAGGRDE